MFIDTDVMKKLLKICKDSQRQIKSLYISFYCGLYSYGPNLPTNERLEKKNKAGEKRRLSGITTDQESMR